MTSSPRRRQPLTGLNDNHLHRKTDQGWPHGRGGLCDDDPLLKAGAGGPLKEGGPEVGGDGLAGEV